MDRVLIVKLGAIGDVIMAIPAAWALHQRGVEIDWVCGRIVAPLLDCYPWIRTFVADDKSLLTGGKIAKLKALVSLWRVLAGRRYGLCATLYYDSRYRWVTLPVRARRKIMLLKTDRHRRLLVGRHHSDEYARILLELDDNYRPTSVTPIRPERLPDSPLKARGNAIRVALVPGGASNMLREQALRRWPVGNYAALAKVLLERGWEVVLLGGPEDMWVREHFAGMAVTNKIGELTLPEVISACDSCDAVVSHDTGPLHLAGLSRAKVLALFGPTDPGNFMPRRPGVVGIWGGEGFACRPCYDGREFAPCKDNGCMQQLTIEMVMTQLDKLLGSAEGVARLVMPFAAMGL